MLALAERLAAATTLGLALESVELHATRRSIGHLRTQPGAVAGTPPSMASMLADKVCLQSLSAFWPNFGGFSADKVCHDFLDLRGLVCADKPCLQNLLTKFVCGNC